MNKLFISLYEFGQIIHIILRVFGQNHFICFPIKVFAAIIRQLILGQINYFESLVGSQNLNQIRHHRGSDSSPTNIEFFQETRVLNKFT